MKEHLIFKEKHIKFLQKDVQLLNISSQINSPEIKLSVDQISKRILQEICSDLPNAFQDRRQHVPLPYEKDFDESKIPTKAHPAQMNYELLKYCKN